MDDEEEAKEETKRPVTITPRGFDRSVIFYYAYQAAYS